MKSDDSLLVAVKEAVVDAGREALERWGAVRASTKPDESFVTEVDQATERSLFERVQGLVPGAAFLGEEYGYQGADADDVWVCDPIDGTTNYVWGLPHWCVSLGLLSHGEAVLGAVYAPVLGDLYWGARGNGAFRNGERLAASPATTVSHEDVVCMSSNALKSLDTSALVGRVRCLGSIALEVCLTAEGKTLATVGVGEGIVDLAAALCFCSEVGCAVGYLDGSRLTVGELLQSRRTGRHFIAGSEALSRSVMQQVRVRLR